MTKSEGTRYSAALSEAAEIRWKQLGYASKGDYRRALERYDLMVQGNHPVTLAIAKMPEVDQERIDEGLLDLTKRGIGKRGQLLQRLIDLVKAAGAEPTGQTVAETIRRRTRKT